MAELPSQGAIDPTTIPVGHINKGVFVPHAGDGAGVGIVLGSFKSANINVEPDIFKHEDNSRISQEVISIVVGLKGTVTMDVEEHFREAILELLMNTTASSDKLLGGNKQGMEGTLVLYHQRYDISAVVAWKFFRVKIQPKVALNFAGKAAVPWNVTFDILQDTEGLGGGVADDDGTVPLYQIDLSAEDPDDPYIALT